MKYNIDNSMSEFSRKMTSNSNLENIKKVLDALDDGHREKLDSSCLRNSFT